MNFVKLFLDKPIISHFLFISIFIFGLIAVLKLPVESMPSVNLDFSVIVALYPGGGPEEIEKIITIPIEDAVANVQDVNSISSRSENGKSVVIVNFVENVKNYDQRIMDLQTETNKISNLPDKTEMAGPFVYKIAVGDTTPILTVMLSGDIPDDKFKDIAEDLNRALTNKIKDIKNIEIAGVAEKEVAVYLDTEKLLTYSLSIDDIFTALYSNDVTIPCSEIDVTGQRYLLKTIGNLKNLDQIENIVVREGVGKIRLLLKDVAKIEKKFVRGSIKSNLNSKKAVSLYVIRRADANIVGISEQVKKEAEKFIANYPDINLSFQNDQGLEVDQTIEVLRNNALLGMVLVFGVLLIFLGWRPAILATVAIPFSFLAAFLVMKFFGFTINSLSLFALILASGMIVDQAIVVIENVFRFREMGFSRYEASLKGTSEVIWPVAASVMTTVVAFIPLLMMRGMIGKFIAELPWVVTITLIASLMEAMIILPIHLSSLKKLSKSEGTDKIHWWHKVTGFYSRWLLFQLNHRYLTLLFVTIFFVFSLFVAKQLKIILFGDEVSETITAKVELPQNTSIEKTKFAVNKIESYILKELRPEKVKDIVTVVGRYIEDNRWVAKENVAELRIDMVSDSEALAKEIKEKLRNEAAKIPEIINFEFMAGSSGPPSGKAVDISIAGKEMETLAKISGEITAYMKKLKGVVDLNSGVSEKTNEFVVIPDMNKLAQSGVTLNQLSAAVRGFTAGRYAGKYQDTDGRELNIWIKLPENRSYTLDNLKNIMIKNMAGTMFRIGDIASIKEIQSIASIKREERVREERIRANVDYSLSTPYEINKAVEKEFKNIPLKYPGYSISFKGEAEDQQKVMEDMIYAFLAAFVMIFIILGIQFNSFVKPVIVMATLPFGFIGVAFGLYFSNLPLSLVALISLVSLCGIVVNNSIILVDFINNYTKSRTRREALIEAGKTRLRPILLTTTTTIGGLVPTAVYATGANKMWQPMAITLMWGLIFSTFLTLFIIPCIYEIMADIKYLFIKKKREPAEP